MTIDRLIVFVSAIIFGLDVSAQKITLTKIWETTPTLNIPESAIFDPSTKNIFVGSMVGDAWEKDGKGFISKLSSDGKIETLEWVTGLDAPKGMGILNKKLFVADITKVVVIDIQSGKIEKSIPVEGALALNDITIDSKGTVFVSDIKAQKVFTIIGDLVSVWIENIGLEKPNGLLSLKNSIRLIDMGSGKFYDFGYSDKKPTVTAEKIPNGDGIVEIGKDEYLISSWNGEIYYINGSTVEKVLDTKDLKLNAADIWYIPTEKIVLVPTFFGNNLCAYKVSK